MDAKTREAFADNGTTGTSASIPVTVPCSTADHCPPRFRIRRRRHRKICCWHITTAAKIVAAVEITVGIMAILAKCNMSRHAHVYSHVHHINPEDPEDMANRTEIYRRHHHYHHHHRHHPHRMPCGAFILLFAQLLPGILIFVGLRRKSPCFLMPYMVVGAIKLLFAAIFVLMAAVAGTTALSIIGMKVARVNGKYYDIPPEEVDISSSTDQPSDLHKMEFMEALDGTLQNQTDDAAEFKMVATSPRPIRKKLRGMKGEEKGSKREVKRIGPHRPPEQEWWQKEEFIIGAGFLTGIFLVFGLLFAVSVWFYAVIVKAFNYLCELEKTKQSDTPRVSMSGSVESMEIEAHLGGQPRDIMPQPATLYTSATNGGFYPSISPLQSENPPQYETITPNANPSSGISNEEAVVEKNLKGEGLG